MFQADCPGSISLHVYQDSLYKREVERQMNLVREFPTNYLASEVGKYHAKTNPFVIFLRDVGILGGEPAEITACRRTLRERLNAKDKSQLNLFHDS